MKIFNRSKILHVTFPLFLILTGVIFCLLPGLVSGVSAAGLWQPGSSSPIHWQWQIGTPFNVSTDLIPNVTVYDIDAYDTAASVVSALHAKGFIVIAYASFGTYENWRPDAASFPANVKGSGNGWPGENWLDIRSDAVKTIMAARLDLIKSKGFDAVEPDNVDGYSNSTGFPLTAQDQLNYNQWIAAQCHQRGLSVGLKNDVDQVAALQPYFDWTLNEESYKYNEYSGLSAFTNNNKAVFEVEYGKSTAQASALNALHFNSTTRDLDLLSPSSSGYVRLPCIPDTQNSWTGLPQTTTTTTTVKTTTTTTSTTTTTVTPVVTTGTAKVSTTPSSASITIDGTKSGVSPETITLNNGSHIIQASLTGFQDATSTVNIVAGNNITINLVLNPVTTTAIVHTTTTTSTPPPVTTTAPPTTTTTSIVTAPIAPPPSGGGGGGYGPSAPTTVAGVTALTGAINAQGVFTLDVVAWSDDKLVAFVIGTTTKGMDSTGAPLTKVSILGTTTVPGLPTGAHIVGLAYDFEQSGAVFTPTVPVRFNYNPALLPEGIEESDLQIAYFDTVANTWVPLLTTIDTGNHFMFALIAHFTTYAVTCGVPAPAPVPMTATTPLAPTTTTSEITNSTIPPAVITTVTPTATDIIPLAESAAVVPSTTTPVQPAVLPVGTPTTSTPIQHVPEPSPNSNSHHGQQPSQQFPTPISPTPNLPDPAADLSRHKNDNTGNGPDDRQGNRKESR